MASDHTVGEENMADLEHLMVRLTDDDLRKIRLCATNAEEASEVATATRSHQVQGPAPSGSQPAGAKLVSAATTAAAKAMSAKPVPCRRRPRQVLPHRCRREDTKCPS
ncbi:unnamed protein product [Symbiodinium sp. KB8]|nr:unnamed protein product [Symbiodinium sp. KB8]